MIQQNSVVDSQHIAFRYIEDVEKTAHKLLISTKTHY